MDLKEAIKHVQDTSQFSLEPVIEPGDGSGRRFLFNFATGEYEPIERFVKQEGGVSTVESFAELVAEYAARFSQPTGKNMTVTFSSLGATFSPDDYDRRHSFTYRRVLSQQWQVFAGVLGKPMTHKGLIRTLQALSPSILDYPQTFAAFQRLAISKDVKVTSEPVLNTKGDSQNFYKVNLSIKGAVAGETTLPSQITVELQYTRGSAAKYQVTVEVDLSENDGTPVITLFAPTLDAVADQAVLDELAYFETEAEKNGLTDLLCVVNF